MISTVHVVPGYRYSLDLAVNATTVDLTRGHTNAISPTSMKEGVTAMLELTLNLKLTAFYALLHTCTWSMKAIRMSS